MRQGEIYLANLNPAKGREQAGFRPVLVMQNDFLNKNLSTVLVAPITSIVEKKGLLTTHFLAKKKSGLPKDSLALLFQMRTLDKMRLKKKVGKLDPAEFARVKGQLKFVF